MMLGLFPGPLRPPDQSSKVGQRFKAVTTSGLRNVDLIAIGYGCRPRLRGRLTLRGLALRRNPWTSGDRVSHSVDRYSCQHAHFRYLQRPSRAAFTGLRNAPLPLQRTDDRRQMTDQNVASRSPPHGPDQTLQHHCDLAILLTPSLPGRFIDVAEIETIAAPQPHLVGRSQRRSDSGGSQPAARPGVPSPRPGWRRPTCSRGAPDRPAASCSTAGRPGSRDGLPRTADTPA